MVVAGQVAVEAKEAVAWVGVAQEAAESGKAAVVGMEAVAWVGVVMAADAREMVEGALVEEA